MTAICVVTSFSANGWGEYGRRFAETFLQYWPQSVKLTAYYEGQWHAPEHVAGVDLLDTEPCKSFLERHRHDPVVSGRAMANGQKWKPGLSVYNFRYDAYKFARKVFAIAHAARQSSGKLFWVDADVETKAVVSEDLLHHLLPDGVSICHLARPGYHSECGFVGYNLEVEPTRQLIEEFERLYSNDEFFDWSEWHDSWLFDRLIEKHKPHTFAIPHNSRGQPFAAAPLLSGVFTHHKGKKKDRLAS